MLVLLTMIATAAPAVAAAAAAGVAEGSVAVGTSTSAPIDAEIDAAEAAVAALEYERAREQLLTVVATQGASEAQLLRAHLLAGQVDRVLDRDVDARMHFLWVLTRAPDSELPADAPPKIRSFFVLVRDEALAQQRARAAPPEPVRPPVVVVAAPAHAPASPSLVPLGVAAGGAALALVGVGAAALGEVGFADPGARWEDRQAAQLAAVVGWGATVAGGAVAGAAVVWWVIE